MPFGDEPTLHPFLLPRNFSAPFSAPKIFPPTDLPHPTSLTSFPAHLMAKALESSPACVAQSFQETWDTRLEQKKGKLLPSFTFVFSPLWLFLSVFFFFLLLEQKKMKAMAIVFFFLFFLYIWSEEGNGTSMSWPSFSFLACYCHLFFSNWCCCKKGDDSYCHLFLLHRRQWQEVVAFFFFLFFFSSPFVAKNC